MLLKKYTLTGPPLARCVPVQWIEIQETRDQENLISEFRNFLSSEHIYSPISAGHSGGGSYAAAFLPDDAERIRAWLRKQGVKFVHCMPERGAEIR